MTHHTINIQNLYYSYPDGHAALKGVSLNITPGEKVALVGPNGAGKSTLLLHLNGILSGQGQVAVCHVTVGPQTLKQVRAMVGLVFQSPDDQLFSPTVFEDVAYGPIYAGLDKAGVEARVEKALAAVGMQAYARRTSFHLSLGEKKRIAIACVLAMEPEILALDEPTAGLDPRARRGLINLLRDLPMTMLVATHDLAMVKELLPRTVLMEDGQVVVDGPSGDILNDAELMVRHGLDI